MIKITIDQLRITKLKYLTSVASKVLVRINYLKLSLRHLQGIKISNDEDGFTSYKVVTEKIVNLTKVPKIEKSEFIKIKYIPFLTGLIGDPDIATVNLNGLLDLMKYLSKRNGKQLRRLLVCNPEKLEEYNSWLLSSFNVDTDLDKKVIKLAFDYTNHDEISDPVRAFFRGEDFVKYCPYCNMLEADYSITEKNTVATIPYLDHFFNKAHQPLLSYSMYNLIPCDMTCNSTTNKGEKPFFNEYHLNPYSEGFENSMTFQPGFNTVGQPLSEIHLHISSLPATLRWKQLVGNCASIDESNNFGNINVFSLKARYNRSQIVERTDSVASKILDLVSSRNSLNHFLNRMGFNYSPENYRLWYKHEVGTLFDEKDFNRHPFSKLHRDLHDDILSKDLSGNNQDIKDIIHGI